MSDSARPLYVLPFRVVVLAVFGLVVIGALSGALGAWLVLRRLPILPQEATRVLERAERGPVSGQATSDAVEQAAERLAQILDGRDRVLAHAVPVTSDGLFVSAGPLPPAPLRLRARGRDPVAASVVRVYPESGLFFVRVAGTFSEVNLERGGLLPAGTLLSAVALEAGGGDAGVRVRRAAVERVAVAPRGFQDRYPGLGLTPLLAEGLPPSYQGALFLTPEGRPAGLGLLEGGTTVLVSGDVIQTLLDDTLRHPGETVVPSASGLHGQWSIFRESSEQSPGEGSSVVSRLEFRLAEVSRESIFAAAGLRAGDRIRSANGQPLSPPLPLFRPFLEAARDARAVPLSILRGSETIALEVQPVLR